MPFFMYVSGLFSQIKDREKYQHGILVILETYIVFQIIRCIKPFLVGGSFHIDFSIFLPKGTLWYLAYLVIYRLFVYFMPKHFLNNYPKTLIITSIIIALLWGFIPLVIFEKLFSFFPYFLMGYYSSQINIKEIIKRIPLFISLIGIVSIFFIIYFAFNFNICYVVYYETSYYLKDLGISSGVLFLSRIIALIISVIISVFIMRMVLYKKIFPEYGSKTLFIYMYHTFIVLTFRYFVAKYYLPQNEIILLLYAIAILIGLILLSRYSFFTYLMNPFTYINNKYQAKK
jgi:fucose 4-O-acetylase-like acetyltransferase